MHDQNRDLRSSRFNWQQFMKNSSHVLLSSFLLMVTLLGLYPGSMTNDSLYQFNQVVTGEVNNWHPPIMVYIWRLTNCIIYGPGGMLILQAFLYWGSVCLIADYAFDSPIKRSFVVLAMGLFPPAFAMIGVIWKDVLCMVSFMTAVALLLQSEKKQITFLLPMSLVFLFVVFASRWNALFAVPPLLYMVVERWMSGHTRFKTRMLFTVVIFLLFTGLGFIVNHYKVKRYDFSNLTLVWDLWGMSTRSDQKLVPDYLFIDSSSMTLRQMEAIYNPYYASIYFTRDSGLRTDILTDKDLLKRLKIDFLRTVYAHPLDYLYVRARVVARFLGLTGQASVAYHFGIEEHSQYPFSIVMRRNFLTKLFQTNAERGKRLYLFKPWIYLLILIEIVLLAFVKELRANRRVWVAIAVALSGLLYWMPYPLILPCTDFRYNSLTIVACLISCILLMGSGQFSWFLRRLAGHLLWPSRLVAGIAKWMWARNGMRN